MKRLLLPVAFFACSGGENPPRNDTAVPGPSPASPSPGARPAPSPWNADAGLLFALHASGDVARIVNPAFSDAQALDTLSAARWGIEGTTLDLVGAGRILGTGRIESLRTDSTCVGWPLASVVADGAALSAWRVAFPAGRVDAIPFDSLSTLSGSDSIAVTTAAARAASRIPGDTADVFRGRPYVVRQANRVTVQQGRWTLLEVLRLVPQEANPLHEQLVMILGGDPSGPGPLETAFSERRIGLEEAIPSIELLAALRLRSSGTLAMLVRREHEGGFVLQWLEQSGARWTLRWQSALDGC